MPSSWTGRSIPSSSWTGRVIPSSTWGYSRMSYYYLQDVDGDFLQDSEGNNILILALGSDGEPFSTWTLRTPI